MTEPEILVADAILRSHDVRYVVVGGQAIGKQFTMTQDVDVMVTTSDYDRVLPRLKEDTRLRLEWEDDEVTRFRMSAVNDVPLDVINAKTFSGSQSSASFLDFLIERHSTVSEDIRYASPSAVWYTRLLVPQWRAYSEKILRNIVGGLSPGRLAGALEIGEHFGTAEILRERINYLRSELKKPDLEFILADE